MFVNLKTIMMTMAITVILTEGELLMNRDGCGKTKACLFKPVGCNPNLDCTIGLIFFVVGPNQLRIEMVATSLIPSVQQQYVAIGFSNDTIMGDDFVTECVMSNMGEFSGSEPEVFVSYNHGKSNDRIFLNDHEHRTLISNISSHVIDGRLVCHFTQQIIPQIDRKNGLIGDLDKDFFIMGATGSAQPDEVNAHDTNRGSHFYPIVSSAKINPSLLDNVKTLENDQSLDANMIPLLPFGSSSVRPFTETSTVASSTYSETITWHTSLLSISLSVTVLLLRLLI